MVHGRIEPSPAEQLVELRRSRDRYAALAEKLHDDPELTLEEKLAREQDARRIAHAYENSITNAVARMTSLESTHRAFHFSLGMRAWLAIFVAISILEGGALLAYFRPEIFRLTMPQKNAVELGLVASVPAAPKAAPPVAPKVVAPPVTPPRPLAAPSVSPSIAAAPKPIMRPETAPKPVSPAPQIAKAVAPPPVSPASKTLVHPAMLAAPKPLTPPQLELITPPPVDVPPMPVIVLEEPPPTAQSTPAPAMPAPTTSTSVTPPVAATATPAPATPFSAAPTATAQPAPPPAAAVQPPTRIEAIAGTHTLPPYPDTSKRLAESGTTKMQVAISALGTATECTIVKSSGSTRLDIAACSHVQAIWRWKPATRDGQPVATNAVVTVVWSLLNAR